MFRVQTPSQFEKALLKFLKAHPDLVKKTKSVLKELSMDPMSKRYHAHKLKGGLKGTWAASITYGYRVVYFFTREEIYFLDIGAHDEVY